MQEFGWRILWLRDGTRRFLPSRPDSFVEDAVLAGREILENVGWPGPRPRTCTDEEKHSYRLYQLIYNRAYKGHAFIKLSMSSAHGLYVRPAGRGGGIETSVLPAHVGMAADGSGSTWSPARLLKEGFCEAIQARIAQPSETQRIAFGLAAASAINPLPDLPSQAIRNIVFESLFDCSRLLMSIDEPMVDEVLDRLNIRIEEHSEDADEEFGKWFVDEKSNLPKSLASMKRRQKLDRDTVKAALVKISWRSFDYIASCLATFCRALMLSLPEPMNEVELRQFSSLYLPQRHFGDLPLVMILDRSELIAPVVGKILSKPDDRGLHAVLHRLLATFAEIVVTRREADRRFKAKRRPGGGLARETSISRAPDLSDAAAETRSIANEILGDVLEDKQLGCPHCLDCSGWEVNPLRVDASGIHLEVRCARHDFFANCTVSTADVEAARRGFR